MQYRAANTLRLQKFSGHPGAAATVANVLHWLQRREHSVVIVARKRRWPVIAIPTTISQREVTTFREDTEYRQYTHRWLPVDGAPHVDDFDQPRFVRGSEPRPKDSAQYIKLEKWSILAKD